jgi:TonB family protein
VQWRSYGQPARARCLMSLYMARSILACMALLTVAVTVTAQDGRPPAKKYDSKRCTPKVEKQQSLPKNVTVRTRKDEKATGYPPLISFLIMESGRVAHARVKRSSGFAEIDRYALEWIRGKKYNTRSGCGVIATEADVLIHWTSGA